MKKKILIVFLTILSTFTLNAKSGDVIEFEEKNFTGKVIVDGLESPWALTYGPDNRLWLTERSGKHVSVVNPTTGEYKVLYTFDNAFVDTGHEGVLGLSLSPNFLTGKGKDEVFVSYTYKDGENEYARIVKLTYDKRKDVLKNEKVILDKLPANNDHNAGRLIFGPDGKIYYSIGDLGHNFGSNIDKKNEAQRTPKLEEIMKNDYSSYAGSVLRINVDGSIPSDNPMIDGVISHVFTYGHRNPQGLTFINDRLFSSEHGPSSDDEINLLEAGKNYGWPYVSGYKDNQGYQFVDNSDNKKVYNELDFNAPNYKEPLKTFYTVSSDYDFSDNSYGIPYLSNPTIAPSNLVYYPSDGEIVEFRNALLVTALKNGAVYVLPMDGEQKQVQGDVIKVFKTNNRYRNIVVSPDTGKLYVITDSTGNAVGVNRNLVNSSNLQNKGAIIEIEYVK